MNTHFFQVTMQESGHGRVPEYKVLHLSGHRVPVCMRFPLVPRHFYPQSTSLHTHNSLLHSMCKHGVGSDRTKWTKEEITTLTDVYSDAKTSANPMTTNRDLHRSIADLLKQNNEVECSTKQIKTKMKKLKTGYSKLKDRMKVSGAERPYDYKALTSTKKVAFQHWDKLDRILGRLSFLITNYIYACKGKTRACAEDRITRNCKDTKKSSLI